MNDMPMIALCAGLLALAYVLHGGHLALQWGVDPSRRTPALRRGGAALPGLVYAALCAGHLFYLAACTYEKPVSAHAALAAVCAVILCGMLGFASLFVSVRHEGGDMAQIAEEELFPGAWKLMYGLCALAFAPAAAVLACLCMHREWALNAPDAAYIGFYAALLAALAAWYPAARMAPRVRSETSLQRLSYGGAVFGAFGAAALLAPLADELYGLGLHEGLQRMMMLAAFALAFVLPACVFIRLAGSALRGLTRRLLPMKRGRKKAPAWAYDLLSAALCALLVYAGGRWMLWMAAAAAAALALVSAACCVIWLRRIGRGPFQRI
ncbi:MAG: hypothetical protein IJE71_05500 [Clostridia bacterium]|nr:hypothetical protein [Clostridia bacterium]